MTMMSPCFMGTSRTILYDFDSFSTGKPFHLNFGRNFISEGEPKDRAATVGPSSFSPSSWNCTDLLAERAVSGARTKFAYVYLVGLPVAESQELVEVVAHLGGGQIGV